MANVLHNVFKTPALMLLSMSAGVQFKHCCWFVVSIISRFCWFYGQEPSRNHWFPCQVQPRPLLKQHVAHYAVWFSCCASQIQFKRLGLYSRVMLLLSHRTPCACCRCRVFRILAASSKAQLSSRWLTQNFGAQLKRTVRVSHKLQQKIRIWLYSKWVLPTPHNCHMLLDYVLVVIFECYTVAWWRVTWTCAASKSPVDDHMDVVSHRVFCKPVRIRLLCSNAAVYLSTAMLSKMLLGLQGWCYHSVQALLSRCYPPWFIHPAVIHLKLFCLPSYTPSCSILLSFTHSFSIPLLFAPNLCCPLRHNC